MRALDNIDARFAALVAALMLYAVAGSPTPDNPGLIEALIGVLLALSATLAMPTDERRAFLPLLVLGLTIPPAMACFAGRGIESIARDIIPFLFLCLPVFVYPQGQARLFLQLCLLVGVIFAVRVLGQGLGWLPAHTELLYLANSPLVVLSAITGLGVAGIDLYHRQISLKSIVFFCGGLVCLLAMLIDVQRATIIAVIVSLCVLGVVGLFHAPRRMLWPSIILLVVILASHDVILSAWQGMATKTALVGVNARWQELMAVHDHLSGAWLRVLFGIGWGGRFDSPAVGGWSVAYTHSLLTYMLLKTGWVGLGATLIAIGVCLREIIIQRTFLALALFWAIIIPVMLYASYKSLDFGLVLVLALLLSRDMEMIRK